MSHHGPLYNRNWKQPWTEYNSHSRTTHATWRICVPRRPYLSNGWICAFSLSWFISLLKSVPLTFKSLFYILSFWISRLTQRLLQAPNDNGNVASSSSSSLLYFLHFFLYFPACVSHHSCPRRQMRVEMWLQVPAHYASSTHRQSGTKTTATAKNCCPLWDRAYFTLIRKVAELNQKFLHSTLTTHCRANH